MRRWLAMLLLCGAVMAQEPPSLPFDLVGTCNPPVEAWRMPGVVPGATVLGFDAEGQTALLVGGRRQGEQSPPLGDLAVVSPRGWARRRIVADNPLYGLPGMLRKVVLAGDDQGQLHVWPLGYGDRESAPWTVKGDGPVQVGPLVVGETFVFVAGQTIYSVTDLIEPRWKRSLPEPVTTPLASDGGTIYLSCGAKLLALKSEDGEPVWQIDLPGPARTGWLVTAGLAVAGFADGAVRAYDAATGEAVWEHLPKLATDLAPDLALAGPWLIAAGADGSLQALEAALGEPVWSADAPEAAPFGSPTVGFGRVFVIDGLGRLQAIPFDSAQDRWKWLPKPREGALEKLTGVASIHGQRLYVTTTAGALLALDLPNADGPAPWPVTGGTAARNGRVFVAE